MRLYTGTMKHYKYWLALEQSRGMGPAHLKEIYDSLSGLGLSIIDLFSLTPAEIKNELALKEPVIEAIAHAAKKLSMIEEECCTLLESGIEMLLFFEEQYPFRLARLMKSSMPPILYLYGNREILNTRGAAVLGDSNVSGKGEVITYLAAKELVRHRIAVISGFARGADLIAHRAALENGGDTIAVLPYGFAHLKVPGILHDVFNPQNMLLVSQFSYGREYTQFNAMQRNKLACALSHAAFIVEAPTEGGIFEAGKSARNLAIPLYVTEYSSYPESAAGNAALIRDFGALPVRGRMINNTLSPNLDRLIADIKFGP